MFQGYADIEGLLTMRGAPWDLLYIPFNTRARKGAHCFKVTNKIMVD